MRAIFSLIPVAIISGCATLVGSAGVNWSEQHPGKIPDYENAKIQAEEAIKNVLKDPNSAQFRNWTPFFKTLYNFGLGAAGKYEPLWAICVQVNAKNSYGGYAGDHWYYVKFRDGLAVRDSLGVGQGEYDCTHAPKDPSRQP